MFDNDKCDCGCAEGKCFCAWIKGNGRSSGYHPYHPYSPSKTPYGGNPYKWDKKSAGKKKLQEELAELKEELDILREENGQLKGELAKRSALIEELFNRLMDSESVSDE